MTTLKDVVRDILLEILDRWNEDREKMVNDRVYREIDDAIEEVMDEYLR